ncbi:MAG: sulfatase/phosphatase domain-containing protein, partial [Planctomycetota bacterium]
IAVPESVEGKSLLDLYNRQVPWDRKHIFASFVSPIRHKLNIRCVRTERYKLVHHLTTEEIELYDLEKDPYELENLAGHRRFTKLQKQLIAQLSVWRTKVEHNDY